VRNVVGRCAATPVTINTKDTKDTKEKRVESKRLTDLHCTP
jgi:hypothetical protein